MQYAHIACCVNLLQTPVKHGDYSMLEQAISAVEEVIAEVDTRTGLSKCQFAISRLDYVDDRQVMPVALLWTLSFSDNFV